MENKKIGKTPTCMCKGCLIQTLRNFYDQAYEIEEKLLDVGYSKGNAAKVRHMIFLANSAPEEDLLCDNAILK